MERPRTGRDFLAIRKFPVRNIGAIETKVVTQCGRHVETGAPIQVGFRLLFAKDILPVIGAEGTAIAPLGVADFSGSIAHGHPSIATDRLAVFGIDLLKPGDHESRFGLRRPARDVVVGQGYVEGILTGNEFHREEVAPRCRIRVVIATKVVRPICIPRTASIVGKVVSSGWFTDPKNGGHDAGSPRITIASVGTGNRRALFRSRGGSGWVWRLDR